MTANPDVLGPDEEVDAGLDQPGAPPVPAPARRRRRTTSSAWCRCATSWAWPACVRPTSTGPRSPPGSKGVVAAETALGDVRGEEGFFHYRQYSAVDLAARSGRSRTSGTCCSRASFPTPSRRAGFAAEVAALRALPPGLAAMLPEVAANGLALRGAAHRGVVARCRAGVAPHPRHRRCGVAVPDAAAVRGGADHHGGRLQPG